MAPDWLTASQRAVWDAAITDAPKGLLGPLDRAILAIWAVAYDRIAHANAALAEGGLCYLGRGGIERPSPYLRILAAETRTLLRAAIELGFTPSSRGRIDLPELPSEPWPDLDGDPDGPH
ncbi:MAG: P27 family phage terminase small subunit [Burkholderiales bacterium]